MCVAQPTFLGTWPGPANSLPRAAFDRRHAHAQARTEDASRLNGGTSGRSTVSRRCSPPRPDNKVSTVQTVRHPTTNHTAINWVIGTD
jgi:hypothetical protein